MTLRVLSLFDGIGAAYQALTPLGFTFVGRSEIDEFAIAVTEARQPGVRQLGDVSAITEETIAGLGRIDMVIGGFPCQDLSIAGRRAGLRNDDGTLTRSGLFFDAMRVVRWAREHCGLRWLIIENVPGLFSSNGGRDFAAVVAAVAGSEFGVPRDGWRNAGVALGPEGLVEWCTLDSQYFGLAQRRVRVFLAGDLGDWASRPPLFALADGLAGHPSPRRGPREGAAPAAEGGPRARGGERDGPDDGRAGRGEHPRVAQAYEVANCLTQRMYKGINTTLDEGQTPVLDTYNQTVSNDIAHTLCSRGDEGGNRHLIPAVLDEAERPSFDWPPEVADPIVTSEPRTWTHEGTTFRLRNVVPGVRSNEPIPFDETQLTHPENRSNPQPGDPTGTLPAFGRPPTVALDAQTQNLIVRRLTPLECERLQGFADGFTAITFRGKPAADTARYKALGNSFSVPVIAWIGRRILEAHAASTSPGTP